MELSLGQGMVLVSGANGQGKSNLLESVYLLAIAKSPRAASDRELMRRQHPDVATHTRVAARLVRGAESLRVQIDLARLPPLAAAHAGVPTGTADEGPLQKRYRVNGVDRRASEMVGQLNAVLFTASDLEFVYGPPSVRRRYLDILISQLDRGYLRSLQRYQNIVRQRNRLLRMVRIGSSRPDELDFWNQQLVLEGQRVTQGRGSAVQNLSRLARPAHEELSGGAESLDLVYRPNVDAGDDESAEAFADAFRRVIEERLDREIAQGVTLAGPHRDDVLVLAGGASAASYASRGQVRTAALAIKLAEAAHIADRRGQQPVLLLDDVLSELDASRRAHVLSAISNYEQCIISTADPDAIESRILAGMSRFVVEQGRVSRE